MALAMLQNYNVAVKESEPRTAFRPNWNLVNSKPCKSTFRKNAELLFIPSRSPLVLECSSRMSIASNAINS